MGSLLMLKLIEIYTKIITKRIDFALYVKVKSQLFFNTAKLPRHHTKKCPEPNLSKNKKSG